MQILADVAYCKHASNVIQEQITTINPATGKIITSPNDPSPQLHTQMGYTLLKLAVLSLSRT